MIRAINEAQHTHTHNLWQVQQLGEIERKVHKRYIDGKEREREKRERRERVTHSMH